MYDVITIGSAIRDVFFVSRHFKIISSPQFSTGKGECISLGSKIDVDELVLATGGGATNAAATFASLGFNTATITRVGEDDPGDAVIKDLRKFGVKTTLVNKVKNGTTGFSALLTTQTGERSILTHRGVSSDFEDKDIPWSKLKSKWVYMTSLAGNNALALKIAKTATKNGARVAFNPGALELRAGVRSLEPIMRHLTLLNVNLEEAQMLAKSKSRDIKRIASKIAKPGLMLVITDSSNGSYAYLDGTLWFARPRNIKAVSRTGAGDAFGSGLVAALMNDKGIDEALQIGTINAESVIQSFGAKQGILASWPNKKLTDKIRVRTL
ncbi:MAG: carbohydrate kinase family protein [Candidatus Uhrbacteria bacterium]|nr:carbohydrate kinase family protein [Candidatus Uhrbacteria bacterium]